MLMSRGFSNTKGKKNNLLFLMTFPNLQLETDHFHRTFFTTFHSLLLQFFVP